MITIREDRSHNLWVGTYGHGLLRFDRRTVAGETRESVLAALQARLAEIDLDAFGVRISADPVSTYTGESVVWERFLAAWQFSSETPLAQAAAASLAEADVAVRFGSYAFCTNGSESAGQRQVLSGLRDGERVVVSPPPSLGDGAAVRLADSG